MAGQFTSSNKQPNSACFNFPRWPDELGTYTMRSHSRYSLHFFPVCCVQVFFSLLEITMFVQDNKKGQVKGSAAGEGSCFQWFWVAKFAKLQPTQSIKRCETYSENVSDNQWKQGSAHCNLASNRASKINPNTWHCLNTCNLCTLKARSTTAQERKNTLSDSRLRVHFLNTNNS